MITEHQALRELLGAYVLDQLSDPERGSVREHLAGCPSCRDEVDQLAPVASALRHLGPAPELIAPAVTLPSRRATVRRAAAGLLVAAGFVGAFAAGQWYAGPGTAPPVVAVAWQTELPGVRADAGLVKHTWGTELKLEATGLADGASYTVTFVDDAGSRVPAGSFLGTGANPVRCSVNAALPIDTATELEITDATGRMVLDARLG